MVKPRTACEGTEEFATEPQKTGRKPKESHWFRDAVARFCGTQPVDHFFTVLRSPNPQSLFYRYRLGEIARLIDVAPAPHGDVVCEQLKGKREHDRHEEQGRRRQLENEITRGIENRVQLLVAA